MHKLYSRRPSPAMVIALVALFASLGGVGYAATKVGSKQIANNSIKSADVRNNSIAGKDVRNNSLTGKDVKGLTGADINESKLGSVPTATLAEGAVNAGRASSAGSVDGVFRSGLVKLARGQDKALVTRGQFSLRAVCSDSGGNSVGALLVKNVGTAAAVLHNNYNDSYNPPETLAPGAELDGFYQVETAQGDPYYYGGYYNMFSVVGPDGTALEGHGSIGAEVLGSDCVFNLVLFG
jgi:hypothetical protein